MKKKIIIGSAVVVLLLLAGVIFWLNYRDEFAVRNLISDTAEWVSAKPRKVAHEGALKHTRAKNFFCDSISVKVVKPEYDFRVDGERMEQFWMLYFRNADEISVETENVEVEVSGDQADFSFDAQINGSFSNKQVEFSGVYIVRGKAEKIDGNWKISSVVVEPVVK